NYLVWRLATVADAGAPARVFCAIELLTFLFSLLTGGLLWRGTRREPHAGEPQGTLDVYVPVCGEPAEMVERTLKATLAIEYPHRTYVLNDGRVAGKPGWEEIEELAARHGVPCLTRTDGAKGK